MIFCLAAIIWFSLINIGQAQATTPILEDSNQTEYSENCISKGDCTVEDFLRIGIRISEFVLVIVGSLALIAFVYGGVLFLISSGSSEQVAKGKKVIIGAVIGLFIVFFSYAIINFISTSLGVTVDNIFTSGWKK